MESFYLRSSEIHRDLASEIKTIKLLFYLDNLSDISKGPLYVVPGTCIKHSTFTIRTYNKYVFSKYRKYFKIYE